MCELSRTVLHLAVQRSTAGAVSRAGHVAPIGSTHARTSTPEPAARGREKRSGSDAVLHVHDGRKRHEDRQTSARARGGASTQRRCPGAGPRAGTYVSRSPPRQAASHTWCVPHRPPRTVGQAEGPSFVSQSGVRASGPTPKCRLPSGLAPGPRTNRESPRCGGHRGPDVRRELYSYASWFGSSLSSERDRAAR
jgi:hypothetical protein